MDRNGSVYVVSLGVLFFLTIIGTSFVVRGISAASISDRSADQGMALHVADAAIDQAAINFRTATTTDDVLTRTLPAGSFTILSAVTVGSLQTITARGVAGSEQRDVEAVLQRSPQSVFQYALFGSQAVNVSGDAITDSYDSSAGAYDPATHGHHGDVGTNTTTAGGITVGGSIFVDGQLVVGPDVADPQSVVSGYGPAFVTGGTSPPTDTQDIVSQSGPFPMPLVSPPEGLTCNDLTVNGQEIVTLSPNGGALGNGTYCYRNLDVAGGGQFTASGKVKVYLTGELKLTGNTSVGVPNDPTKMIFLVTSTGGASVDGSIQGTANFYGALYGPNATLNISGNAKVYGSVVTKVANVSGNAEVHYDEALTTDTTVSNLFTTRVISWRDL